MNQLAPYSKAVAALVGSITTALLGIYAADTYVGQVLTIVGVIATAVATFQVPNAPLPERDEAGISDLGLAFAVLLTVVLVAVLTGRL